MPPSGCPAGLAQRVWESLALLALNEPEASIHPDLLGPLAEIVVAASSHWR
jgi:predicted ATPase